MPALMERRKISRTMYQALKRHIIKEREKRKQEQEADVAMERERKEAERRKKQVQENFLVELSKLEEQLESFKTEKKKLFAQLKRILESENTKKENEKKLDPQPYHLQGHNPAVQFLSGTGHMGRPVLLKPSHPSQVLPSQIAAQHHPQHQGKRGRSPSPNPAVPSVFPFAHEFNPRMYSHQKSSVPSQQPSSSHSSYHQGSQSGTVYGGTPSKYAHPSQSAFTSYATQPQKHLSESYTGQSLYPLSQHLQPTGMPPTLNLDSSRLADDKHSRSLSSVHQPPQKGSITTGYPVHSSQNQPSLQRNISGRRPFSSDYY